MYIAQAKQPDLKNTQENGLDLVPEVARRCPLPLNQQATRDSQLYIWAGQIKDETEKMYLSKRDIVCGRSLLDSVVYSYDRGYNDLVDFFLPFTRKWMQTYSNLYWCRPAPDTHPVADGVRSGDWLYQKRIDREFELFIQDILCLPNIEIIKKIIKNDH